MLPAPITDLIVQKIAEAVWKRPELDRLREPIEAMLTSNGRWTLKG